jgi:hypothetical protein
MDHVYSKPDYLLPDGMKDLIDAVYLAEGISSGNVSRQENGISITLELPKSPDIAVRMIARGRHLYVVHKLPTGKLLQRPVVIVPSVYDIDKAQIAFAEDTLRIFIPKYSI